MSKTTPVQFIEQTRREVGKIKWPNRREVVLTTIMVFILASITAVFFFLVDTGINLGLRGLLGLFS